MIGTLLCRAGRHRRVVLSRSYWGRWEMIAETTRCSRCGLVERRSDLIGLRKETSISTLTTPQGVNGSPPAVTSAAAHAHDTSANRHFSCPPGPVTMWTPDAERVSAASRGTESYAERRTEPLAPIGAQPRTPPPLAPMPRQLGPGERLVDGVVLYSSTWLGDDGRPRRHLRLVG